MTPSKLHNNNNNIKCQAITPTISSNKPKVVTATNNNVLNFSSNSITTTTSSHKFNSNASAATSNYITTLKIPASLSKIGKKVSGKSKCEDVTYLVKNSNGNNSNMLTEEDEFFDDEESGKSFGSIEKSKTIAVANKNIKNDFNLKLTGENSTSFTNTHVSLFQLLLDITVITRN